MSASLEHIDMLITKQQVKYSTLLVDIIINIDLPAESIIKSEIGSRKKHHYKN